MHSVLASTPPEAFSSWFANAAYALGIVYMITSWALKISDRMKEQPPPSQTYRTRVDCQGMHARIEQQIAIVGGESKAAIESIRREVKSDIKGIHQRTDDILAAVSRLEGRVNDR